MATAENNMPTHPHAIKRQEANQNTHPPRQDLFDSLSTWLTSPEHAYSSWLSHQIYRDSTKTVYIAMFSRFCHWLRGQGKRLDQCEPNDIRLFLDAPNPNAKKGQHPQKGRQRQQYVRQLERVFAHLGSLGHGGNNPGRQAGYERVGSGSDKPTRFLTEGETQAVMIALQEGLARLRKGKKGPEVYIEYRDLALIGAMIGGGLKVCHIERLTLNCMDLREERIELSLPGYTHRARIMTFAVEPIAAWLSIQAQLHGDRTPEKHPVFEADRSSGFGRNTKTPFMHASSVHRRTQRFLEAAGITGERASAQTLRNTYAGILIEGGASDDQLVDFLGLKASITAQRLRHAYTRSRAAENSSLTTDSGKPAWEGGKLSPSDLPPELATLLPQEGLVP